MKITLKNPLDMHLHLREGLILQKVFPYTCSQFVGGVVMPNLSTPLINVDLALEYQQQLNHLRSSFTPWIAIYLTESLTIDELHKMHQNNLKILKLYPKGSTTNSQNGIAKILTPATMEILQEAQKLGIILSIHAESNGYSLDREYEFLPIIHQIANHFPALKIIIEHLSDRRSIETLEHFSNVFATLTLHHITLCLDDVIGGGLNPHCFCKPILKSPQDRDALLMLALSGHPKVSFGSDSAPHLESKKLAFSGSAGIFSAPMLLGQLCELFETHNALEKLQVFVSDNAIKNYDLNLSQEHFVTLSKTQQAIPSSIQVDANERIIPLNAGKQCSWTIV